jgi:NAD(P)-dependent dehydrogenase (short-subunit alcohol dehydrogenase family)
MNRDLSRKIAVVTGGTDGIGKEIARGLAMRGLRVIIIARSKEKGLQAEEELRDAAGNPDVEFLRADLSLMAEVNRVAARLAASLPALHYLVHSAGIVRGRRELTVERIETNFATNYLNRFALTLPLLPLLAAASRPGESARILIVSGAAQGGKVHFSDVNLSSNFSTIRAVLQFCKANDLFTAELARRLDSKDQASSVTVSCLKIGVVKTNIRREFPAWMKLLVPLLFDPLLGQSREEAAEAALHLLLSKDLEGVTGEPFLKITKLKRLAPKARPLDRAEAQRLWDLSERLTGQNLILSAPQMPATRAEPLT